VGTRRRIEITAFRRATIVYSVQPGKVLPDPAPVETELSVEAGINSAQVAQVELAEARPITTADTPELRLLVDALVKNDGDVARAAEQQGISRNDFLSKLCGFGLPIK